MNTLSPLEFTWHLENFIRAHPDLQRVGSNPLQIDCVIDTTPVELHLNPLWNRYVQTGQIEDAEWALANNVQRTLNEIRYGREEDPPIVLHNLLRPLLVDETQAAEIAQQGWHLFWWHEQPAVVVAQYPCHYRPLGADELTRIHLTPDEAWFVAIAGLTQASQSLSVRLTTHESQYDGLRRGWIAYIHHDHSGYAATRIVIPEVMRKCRDIFDQTEPDDIDIAVAIPDRNMLIAVPARTHPIEALALDLATSWSSMEYPVSQRIFILDKQSGQIIQSHNLFAAGSFWTQE